jgi:quinol monooxygenase YgiN
LLWPATKGGPHESDCFNTARCPLFGVGGVSDEIAWRIELSVKLDQVGNLLALTDQMVESARAEVGCLSYQRFISPDGKSVQVYERYLNSGAALAHLTIFFQRFGARYATMVERKTFTVYGAPSSELRQMLDQFDPQYLRPFGNFEYWA